MKVRFMVLGAFLLCACGPPPCPDDPAVALFQDGDLIDDENGELVARARPSDPRPLANGGTHWSFTFDDATTLELLFPIEVSFPAPPLTGCCDIRLPATPLSARDEVQIFADDGLWLEISSPRDGRTTEGMHAVLVDTEESSACSTPDTEKHRYQILFHFSSEPASLGDSRTGTLSDLSVRGFVARDFYTGEESGPQAIIGRAN